MFLFISTPPSHFLPFSRTAGISYLTKLCHLSLHSQDLALLTWCSSWIRNLPKGARFASCEDKKCKATNKSHDRMSISLLSTQRNLFPLRCHFALSEPMRPFLNEIAGTFKCSKVFVRLSQNFFSCSMRRITLKYQILPKVRTAVFGLGQNRPSFQVMWLNPNFTGDDHQTFKTVGPSFESASCPSAHLFHFFILFFSGGGGPWGAVLEALWQKGLKAVAGKGWRSVRALLELSALFCHRCWILLYCTF